MFDVVHRLGGYGWDFSCGSSPALQGGSQTYTGSKEAAEHAVRRYLGAMSGERITLAEARRRIRHQMVIPEGYVQTH